MHVGSWHELTVQSGGELRQLPGVERTCSNQGEDGKF